MLESKDRKVSAKDLQRTVKALKRQIVKEARKIEATRKASQDIGKLADHLRMLRNMDRMDRFSGDGSVVTDAQDFFAKLDQS